MEPGCVIGGRSGVRIQRKRRQDDAEEQGRKERYAGTADNLYKISYFHDLSLPYESSEKEI